MKALPWFGTVREKLTDPAYSGWFLHFRPNASNFSSPRCTGGKCSSLFHDQDQTPSTGPDADGRCLDECDCGSVPCGEYLWDHRNLSLRRWLIDDYIMGPTALGHGRIDGLFLDDEWQDSPQPNPSWGPPEGFCTSDLHGGPSETYPNCTLDMGLSQEDVSAITAGWKETLAQVQEAALAAGHWIWQLLTVVGAPPPDRAGCVAYFREACTANSTAQTSPILFSFSGAKTKPLPSPVADLAAFLLTRGPYAWIGYQWIGCVSCHLSPTDPKGLCDPTGAYERPPSLDVDYGVPVGLCAETSRPGVFERAWTKAHVSFDCNTWRGRVGARE